MKKLLIIGTTLLSFVAFAQENTKISSAIIAIDTRGDIAEGKEYLDQARQIIDGKDAAAVSKKNMAKFLHYYGKVHFLIFRSDNENIKSLDEKPLDKAIEYFYRSVEFENSINKNYFKRESSNFIPGLLTQLINRGLKADADAKEAIANGDTATADKLRMSAFNDFIAAYEFGQKAPTNRQDTSLYYNAGFMMFSVRNYELAAEHFNKLIDMGYSGIAYEAKNVKSEKFELFPDKATAEEAVVRGSHAEVRMTDDLTADLYKSLAMTYRLNGDTEKYRATLTKARALFPKNAELIREELQVFLDNKEYDKALSNLEASLELDPDNVVFLYIKATLLYSDVKDLDAAKAAYEEVLKREPKHPEANYMIGVIYIDRANELVEPMNKLGTSAADTKKFDALKAKQKSIYKEAIPFFETAREVSPEDLDVLRALQRVYFNSGSQSKALDIMNLIKKIEAKG
jgi:tetratricopeptide (TPR) repeat protein